MLVRDVAYHGILKELRADYHERFADWLEREAGERANEYEEILGYHLERAHRYLAELGPADERGRELAGRAADSPRILGTARPGARRHPSRGEPARARGIAAARRTIPPGGTSRSSSGSPWPRPAS